MDKTKNILAKLNMHYIFLGLVVVIVAFVAIRLVVWDNRAHQLDQTTESSSDFDTETLDNLVPYTYDVATKDPEDMVIACFGNAPFADDKDADYNLANLIQKKTGATVYNFAFEDSYLSCKNYALEAGSNDLFSLYWLTTIFAVDNDVIVNQYLEATPDADPERVETLSTLQNLDFNDVDVIAIMYDGSDYLDCRGMYNRDDSENIRHFGGALEASIKLIKEQFPHMQIIVMAPPYAYGLEEDGSYIDSTLKTYGEEGPLASYVTYQSEVCYKTFTTFIDVFYDSLSYFVADEILEDHLHLTPEARELAADEFMEGWDYYLRFRNKQHYKTKRELGSLITSQLSFLFTKYF